MNQKMRRGVALGLVMILSWALVGCVTPVAVQQFTAVATDAAAQFPLLARDLTASCIHKQLADRPVNEIEDVSDEARSACKELSDLEPNLLGALNVLVNYLNSLNQLASGEITSYDKQIDGFAAKVQATGGFGDAPVSAIKGLAKFLADAAASGYQRKQLASALQSADRDVTVLTDALSRIIVE